MNKTLANGLWVIIEVGIEMLVKRIKKRRKGNGNAGRLDYPRGGRSACDLRSQSAACVYPVGNSAAGEKPS